MAKNEKISEHGFKVFVVLTFTGTSVLNVPGVLIGKAKQDVWIATIIGIIITLLIVAFYNKVAVQLGNMTLVGYAHKVMGKRVGKIISVYFVLFLILNCVAILWIVGNFISTEILTDTPTLVVNALFMIVVIFGCRLGIEVVTRSAEVLYPWAIAGYIILITFTLPSIKLTNFKPFFEVKLIDVFHAVMLFQAFVSLTFVVFLMIFPASIKNIKEGKKSFYKGGIFAGILLFVLTNITVLVLGAQWASRSMYPSYALARNIQLANALERVEAITAMVWIIAIFYKTVLYFYGAVIGFSEILSLKDYKALTLPLGVIIVILSQVIYPDVVYEMNWDTTTWIPYVFTNAILIPLFLIIVDKMKNK